MQSSPGLVTKLVTDVFYKAIILFHKFHPYSFLPLSPPLWKWKLPTYSWWHPTKPEGLCQPPSPPLSATSWGQQLTCNTEMRGAWLDPDLEQMTCKHLFRHSYHIYNYNKGLSLRNEGRRWRPAASSTLAELTSQHIALYTETPVLLRLLRQCRKGSDPMQCHQQPFLEVSSGMHL